MTLSLSTAFPRPHTKIHSLNQNLSSYSKPSLCPPISSSRRTATSSNPAAKLTTSQKLWSTTAKYWSLDSKTRRESARFHAHKESVLIGCVCRNQQTYISPSDTIQSPATQKLAAFKNRHLGRGYSIQTSHARTRELTMRASAVKPQSLFAKTTSRNADAAASSNMFADMPKAKSDAEGHQSGP